MDPIRILIVEDSPTMRQLLTVTLRGLGVVEFIEAKDGMDALRKLTSETPVHLALVDINMPVLDGLKLINLMRNDPGLQHIPVIVVTTEGGSREHEKALALGACAYVTKPIRAAKLLEVVKQALGQSATRS